MSRRKPVPAQVKAYAPPEEAGEVIALAFRRANNFLDDCLYAAAAEPPDARAEQEAEIALDRAAFAAARILACAGPELFASLKAVLDCTDDSERAHAIAHARAVIAIIEAS